MNFIYCIILGLNPFQQSLLRWLETILTYAYLLRREFFGISIFVWVNFQRFLVKLSPFSKLGLMNWSMELFLLIAELQRAKRASEAPWVRKIGNLWSRENLVMTSAYEWANVHPYRLWGKKRGVSRYCLRSPIRETRECHLSLAVFCLEKSEKHSYLFAM